MPSCEDQGLSVSPPRISLRVEGFLGRALSMSQCCSPFRVLDLGLTVSSSKALSWCRVWPPGTPCRLFVFTVRKGLGIRVLPPSTPCRYSLRLCHLGVCTVTCFTIRHASGFGTRHSVSASNAHFRITSGQRNHSSGLQVFESTVYPCFSIRRTGRV